jgi:hypothetical protein
MAAASVTFQDLNRPLGEVARGLYAWERGEPLEAVLQTLGASARELYARDYTLWVWAGHTAGGERAWALPVSVEQAIGFSPKGPARALARCIDAAVLGEADPHTVRLQQWHDHVCLVAPDMDEELAAVALAHAFAHPSRAEVADLPAGIALGGPGIPLHALPGAKGEGLVALARELSVHPVQVALALADHGQPVDLPAYPWELVASLRDWGCSAVPVEEPDEPPSLAIADDPCPRRRHARTVLQRMLRMGKVGVGYHTEFGHFYRGAAAHERRQALEVAESLLRAGLLGEKPSVGQRHIYLRREALPEIHALIERGETRSPQLAETWTAPAPAEVPAPTARRARSR